MQAAGRGLDTPDQARAFVERELDFPVSHTFGGNSSCVEIETGGGDYVLCDLGSGARAFGNHVLATRGPIGPSLPRLHVPRALGPHHGLSVLHARLHPGQPRHASTAATRRSRRPSAARTRRRRSPWTSRGWAPAIEFVRLEPDRDYEIAGLRVRAKRQHHAGDSYGYRFEQDGKVVVYSTDSEHKQDDPAEIAGVRGVLRATPTS